MMTTLIKKSSRDQLIKTALELIWQSSYGAVSVDEICQKADVRKGSFYHHFESKAALAVSAIEAYQQENQHSWDELKKDQVNLSDRLNNFFDSLIEKHKAHQKMYGCVVGCLYSAIGAETANNEELIRVKSAETIINYVNNFETVLGDRTTAQQLVSFIMGLLTQARILNDPNVLDVQLKQGAEKIIGFKFNSQGDQ